MAQLQVRGLPFLNLKLAFVHIITCVRALEFKHMQMNTLVLIVVKYSFPGPFVRGINENEF